MKLLVLCVFLAWMPVALAQGVVTTEVKEILLCDNKPQKDSITLFLKVNNDEGQRIEKITAADLEQHMTIYEDGALIPEENIDIEALFSGQRIPDDYTFSILVDLCIPQEGKQKIFEAVKDLVESANDSCVYISFFGNNVETSQLITKSNCQSLEQQFYRPAETKYFYSALFAKLAEFTFQNVPNEEKVIKADDYQKNPGIFTSGKMNKMLFVFAEGKQLPEADDGLSYLEIEEFQENPSHIVPKVFTFFYDDGNGIDEYVEKTLLMVANPLNMPDRRGAYKPSSDINEVIGAFEEAVKDEMYDFAFRYRALKSSYAGKVNYKAYWDEETKGERAFSIGAEEAPWIPALDQTTRTSGGFAKYLLALVVTIFTIVFFFFIMKIFIPLVKSLIFRIKYYKKYQAEENVTRRICHFCKREILPGDPVVMRCKHIMHVECWKDNGYKCSEYGQNCKEGVQDHVHWKDLLLPSTLRDCYQTVAGIIAAFVSWIIYELLRTNAFTSWAQGIVNTFYLNDELRPIINDACVAKISSFLMIGLLLGFFLSLIFRFYDGVRKKDWKSILMVLGLSMLSGLIGMASFALGGILLCLLLSAGGMTFIPWYCSLPAYLLFSVCTSLSLTIKSTIPVKSALLGGLFSAIIGFIVLYVSSLIARKPDSNWNLMNMNTLLDFVIYGGGLGASLVTVRMLAEKYFLVVKNGLRAGLRIPIHKWMNATGGGNKVTIGMTERCEIQMTWEKSNKVAKEHAQLYVDHSHSQAMLKPLATKVMYNSRVELPVNKPIALSNNDTFTIGDTMFQYVES